MVADEALESSVVANRLSRGLVTTGFGPVALFLGGWIGTGGLTPGGKLPPIQRQMHRDGQWALVSLFVFGSGRRYKGLPLEEGCGHGHGHVEGGGHGCEGAGKV